MDDFIIPGGFIQIKEQCFPEKTLLSVASVCNTVGDIAVEIEHGGEYVVGNVHSLNGERIVFAVLDHESVLDICGKILKITMQAAMWMPHIRLATWFALWTIRRSLF